MKRIMFALVALSAVLSASEAFARCGRGYCAPRAEACPKGICGTPPVCVKQVEVPARPVYETICHWECPCGTEELGASTRAE